MHDLIMSENGLDGVCLKIFVGPLFFIGKPDQVITIPLTFIDELLYVISVFLEQSY